MNLFIKLLGTGVSLGAGFAGTKLVNTVWEKTTGNKPPIAGKDEDVPTSLRSALTFALISAFVSTVIQVLANRGTQRAITRFAKTKDIV
jgi:ABC-type Fe3+ transport system permease subunit